MQEKFICPECQNELSKTIVKKEFNETEKGDSFVVDWEIFTCKCGFKYAGLPGSFKVLTTTNTFTLTRELNDIVKTIENLEYLLQLWKFRFKEKVPPCTNTICKAYNSKEEMHCKLIFLVTNCAKYKG